jgi:hypothetical protein
MEREGTWKRIWKSPWRAALFAGAGAVLGVAYYELIGCRSGGSCAITSSAWRTAAYFGLVAAVVGFPARAPEKRQDGAAKP